MVKSGKEFTISNNLALFRLSGQTRRMKTPFLAAFILIALLRSIGATPPPGQPRTITDLNVISTLAFQRSVSPKFYKSLLISPIEGWIVVRGNVAGAKLSGLRVVHSELNGRFDPLALEWAKEIQIAGHYSIDRPYFGGSVLVHLLVYQIADGTMALAFPQFTEPGGDQMQYFGCSRLAVLKKDGKWIEIKGPDSLQGKGWAVRQGQKNWIGAFLKTEIKPPGGLGW
jgi:hypothetical protein